MTIPPWGAYWKAAGPSCGNGSCGPWHTRRRRGAVRIAPRIREVHATRGKYVRTEPVAVLYEQGRIHHAGAFDALEEELMAFGGEMEAAGSLDRADALVWAITDLLIDAPDGERGPRIRQL